MSRLKYDQALWATILDLGEKRYPHTSEPLEFAVEVIDAVERHLASNGCPCACCPHVRGDAVDRALTATGPGSVAAWVETRKLGNQRIDVDDRHDEGKVNAAWTAMKTPLAKDAMKALQMVADAHGVEACDEDECYFPRCLGDGCEGEPREDDAEPAAPQTDHRAAPTVDVELEADVFHHDTCTGSPACPRCRATPPSGSPPAVTELRGMTDAETAAHLRKYVKKPGGVFSWPTDACGYDQHIRFVEHRNKNWQAAHDNGDTFDQFILVYADTLDPPSPAAAPGEPVTGAGRRHGPPMCECGATGQECTHRGRADSDDEPMAGGGSPPGAAAVFPYGPPHKRPCGCDFGRAATCGTKAEFIECGCVCHRGSPPESPDGSSAPPSGERE